VTRKKAQSAGPSALALDRKYVWHPFTNMAEWLDPGFEVVTIAGGKGAYLFDAAGNKYLDGNSSIWTNIHGHRHPKLDAAVKKQLGRIAHSSFLGLTNDVAPVLAARLVKKMRAPQMNYRVFFSDDGATAIEAAVKIALQARLQRGEKHRNRFVSLGAGYHGDTVGAMSLSHVPQFHKPFEKIVFETKSFPGPNCYRCPYNRAAPTRNSDQRLRRKCSSECLRDFSRFLNDRPESICAMVMEPRVQGAAGMWMHPPGFLAHVAGECKKHGIWLILDEVMTGFGRAGAFFACQKERVVPDMMALAKGLTGGYLPLAATLVSGEIFDAFLGTPLQGLRLLKNRTTVPPLPFRRGEGRGEGSVSGPVIQADARSRTFFHGHSYCGNQLGSAVALASLDVFDDEGVMAKVGRASGWLKQAARRFWKHPQVGDVRQEGMICAIELVEDFATRKPFDPARRIGFKVCRAAQKHGLLTRPIGDVLVLMPPYCVTRQQINSMVNALWAGLLEVLPPDSTTRLNLQ
jgi:adenosylmethionine-8-amino-7-oxononanoate aminotransferase